MAHWHIIANHVVDGPNGELFTPGDIVEATKAEMQHLIDAKQARLHTKAAEAKAAPKEIAETVKPEPEAPSK